MNLEMKLQSILMKLKNAPVVFGNEPITWNHAG